MTQAATTPQAPRPGVNTTSLAELKAQTNSLPAETQLSFFTAGGFALMQRGATLLSSSTLVPSAYRAEIEEKKYGRVTGVKQNPNAMPNCVLALNMSQRMGADPLMVMQNLYIVDGRPAWSSQFIIAAINGTGFGDILNIMQYGYSPSVSASIAEVGEDAAALAKVLAENNITIAPDLALEAANDIVKLMERGGLQSMNWTISLILCAFTFGFAMDTCGFLKVMLEAIMKPIKTVGGMVTATILSCFVCDIFLGDQYLSIAMPGRMFKLAFDDKGLHPRMLSRSLEDAGTLLSVLIPWNTCGAYHTTVLGVPTVQYIPYAFLNYLNPIVAIIMTYMGIGIFWRGKDGEPVKGGKTRPADLV